MESHFPKLITDVALVDAIVRYAEGLRFFPMLSREIGKTLKPYLDEVTPESSPDLLREMEFFYTKMIEFAPYMSLGHFVKGQFHCKIQQFDKATQCFQGAYDIERDPTRKTWPHLQSSESNARLMIYLGYSLYQAGQTEEGERFFNKGKKMAEKFKPSADSVNSSKDDPNAPKPP